MSENENSRPVNEIEANLRKKSTEELYRIWKAHDESEWTEESYGIAQQILKERIAQEPSVKDTDYDSEDDDSDETDTYANLNSTVRLASWSNYLSWFFVAYAAFALITNIVNLIMNKTYDASTLISFASSLLTPLLAGFFAIFLKGVSQFIYLLMDIEDNTRRSAAANEQKAGN
ncbi:MAG: hypothetical protein P4L50_18930 [Anaerolineaceae bacterium]|nr:hypothetical protein [Anaerolineaceae bacterium]